MKWILETMAMQRAPSFPSEYTTACESRRGISGRVWLLASGGHGGLEQMFQSISEVSERPIALLKENSGASTAKSAFAMTTTNGLPVRVDHLPPD